MAWKTFMVKRTITIALVVAIVFSFGYLASDLECSAQQRLQTVAAFMSGTWDRKTDGSVSVLIPDYPDDQFPREKLQRLQDLGIARHILEREPEFPFAFFKSTGLSFGQSQVLTQHGQRGTRAADLNRLAELSDRLVPVSLFGQRDRKITQCLGPFRLASLMLKRP